MEECKCPGHKKGSNNVGVAKSPRSLTRCLKMNLVTWNTNSKSIPAELVTLFTPAADIHAVGLQELGYQDWLTALDSVLSDKDVVRIKSRRLQGILTIVYVKRDLLPYVTHIESEITRTGFGGFWGNKGGVSIRFDIFGVNLVVVNCHLAPHQENTAGRVQNINEIIDNHKFRDHDVENILDHDYIFWLGDLNFRLDNINYEKTLARIAMENINALMTHDQLRTLMKDGVIFEGFQEAPITFRPTYKFDIGTNVYDTSAKKRIPAYCDRVLFFYHNINYGKRNQLKARSSSYLSYEEFKHSDHKPVSCSIDFLGLCRPPINPVSFKMPKLVSRGEGVGVTYSSQKMELNSNDWIGLYYANFRGFHAHLAYQWVSVGHTSEGNVGHVHFPGSYLSSIPMGSSLVVCYMSKHNSFSGISKEFKLKD